MLGLFYVGISGQTRKASVKSDVSELDLYDNHDHSIGAPVADVRLNSLNNMVTKGVATKGGN